MTIEDARVVMARAVLPQLEEAAPDVAAVLAGALRYAEERLRVNLGMQGEINQLKKKLASAGDGKPAQLELSSISSSDLLDELQRRL